MTRKVLFISDWHQKDDLPVGFCITPYKSNYINIIFWSCKKNTNSSLLYRWYCYIRGALYLIKNQKKYGTIIIWQQMIGYIYFIINIFFPFTKHNNVIVTTMLYTTNSIGIYGQLQKLLIQNSLKYAKGLVWFSSQMADEVRSSLPKYEVKIYNTIMPNFNIMKKNNNLKKHLDDSLFRNGVFCGGKSFRDFNIVIKAFNNTNVPVTIVCPDNERITEKINKENIRVLRFSEVSPDQYYALLDQSFCIIVSLKGEKSSCGQLTFSYAMANSKPVIATNSYGVRDYIKDGENGMLFTLGNSGEILTAYEKLKINTKFTNKLIENAKKTGNNMTPADFVKHILLLVNE